MIKIWAKVGLGVSKHRNVATCVQKVVNVEQVLSIKFLAIPTKEILY